MELKTNVVQDTIDGVTTYYLKLFDQYTNRDVWDIADPKDKKNVSASYLGWIDDSVVDSVNPTLTLVEDEDDEDDEDIPEGILDINFSLSDSFAFTTKDVQETISQIRDTLLSYDLILPPVTPFLETSRELYDIELFDKNFKRFWLLHLDITKVGEYFQVYAGVIAA